MTAAIAITTKVRELQRRLKAGGDYKGPIDGLWGPQTDDGIDALFKRAAPAPKPPIGASWVTPRVAMEVGHSEAVIREAYLDSAGVWTWSVGLTSATGHDVKRYIDHPQTLQHCIDIYVWALRSYCLQVDAVFAGHDLSLEAKAGSASFHWNTGALRTAGWVPAYKAGLMGEAERRFKEWHNSGGHYSKALAERRAREADLIWRGKWSGSPMMAEYRVGNSHRPIWSSRTMVDVDVELEKAFTDHVPPKLDEAPEPLHVPEVPTLSPVVAA